MTGFFRTVVDAATGWMVQSIIGSFFTAQMETWTREIGLTEDFEKLKFEMRNVEMVLAAAEGKIIGDNKPLSQSLDDLKDLLYDSEDVMDELDYYRLQQQIEGKGCTAGSDDNSDGSYVFSSAPSSAFELVYSATSQVTRLALRGRKRRREEEGPTHSTMLSYEIKHDISQRINDIVKKLCTIGNSVQRVLQLETHPTATSSESQNIRRNARLTTSIPIECKVYGRDGERDKIIELLINGGSSDLNVLPVVGIGGVGKTTLARYVYRDERITNRFNLQMWVCVSTNFNEVRLTLEILEHVCKDRQEYEKISNFNVLQEILLRNIRDKRFLLVLDDVWEDKNMSGWIKLLAPLKSNQVNGCMVLATTRMKSVAKMIGTMDEVRLSGLHEKEFWLFFKACAFGNENYEGHPSLQSIGKHIAKALKGCPLAARSVGALLNTNVSDKHWRTIQDKWKSFQEDSDDILPILKLSYDYLPVHLQRCFSYCSLFPEDYPFNGEQLVHAWISQDFVVCEDRAVRLEETGQQYLDRLVDLGFFRVVGSHYVMHDLMHELAGKVSLNECATIHGLKPEAIRPSVRHLSIITTAFDKHNHDSFPNEKFDKILQKVWPLQKLRTLMLFGRSSINLLASLRNLCKEAKCLRFLRIFVTGADISFINSLLNPCHLRYLEYVCVYGAYNNTTFPQALTRFYHLQVLNVGISGNLVVPTDMHKLVNLRHLISHEKVHHAIACVGNMTSLQKLRFKVQNVCSFEIRQLQSMNELVMLEISQLQNVKTKEEACGASLLDKEYLEKLSLSWEDSSMSLEPAIAEDVLEGLQPHHNLNTLEITGYNGATPPTWLSSTFSVTSLQILHLRNCKEWRILPTLEMLPFLRKLTLIRMLNLMEISVPSLEELILINMPKLEKCIGSYGMELTSHLRVLMVMECPQLNDFTLFQSYSSFNAEQKSWFPSLSKLYIKQCPHIIKWAHLPLREMGALKELELVDLHIVKELSVPSLEKLVLSKMPSLEFCGSLTTSPPLQFLPAQGDKENWSSNLRRLTIHDCPCLIVSHSLLPSALISELSIRGVPTLPTMTMTRRDLTFISSGLSVLDDSNLAFHNLRGITSLAIENCPNLVSLSSESFSQLISLEHLRIYKCPNLTKSSITSEVVQENSTSARGLVLPSLKSLDIMKCGITGTWLTQMLPHSQSLEWLNLTDCPEIKFLSISKPTETEGTSSWASAVLTSPQDEQMLKMPYNILRSLKQCLLSSPSFKSVQLRSFMALEELRISGCGHLRVLEGLQFLTSLRSLDIKMNRKLSYEWELKLQEREQGCNRIQLFPPSLEDLRIWKLTDGVQCHLLDCLPTITTLAIERSPELTSLQLGYCTALKTLAVADCKSLASIEGFQLIRNLTSLAVFNSPGVASWLELVSHQQGASEIWSGLETLSGDGSVLSRPFCRQLTSLRRLHFSSWASKHRQSLVSLTEEQERGLQLLTSLQELQWMCPDLLSLPANLHSLTSLETLCIMCCKSITRLPDMGLPPSLRHLYLYSSNEELHMQCRIAATEKLTVMIDGRFVN